MREDLRACAEALGRLHAEHGERGPVAFDRCETEPCPTIRAALRPAARGDAEAGERARVGALERLAAAALAFNDRLDMLMPAINEAFRFQAHHGFPYHGPTWVHELSNLHHALNELDAHPAALTPPAPASGPTTGGA